MVVLLVLLTFIVFITVDYFVQRAQAARAVEVGESPGIRVADDVENVPAGLLLDPSHQWIRIEPDGALRVGVDSFPGLALGGSPEVECRPVGIELQAGEPLVTIRNGNRAVTLSSPLSGTIRAANSLVARWPSAVGADPYGEGWLYLMVPKKLDGNVFRNRFFGEDATGWVRREFGRLRDFLAGTSFANAGLGPALQDGGVPAGGFAQALDEDDWTRLTEAFFSLRE